MANLDSDDDDSLLASTPSSSMAPASPTLRSLKRLTKLKKKTTTTTTSCSISCAIPPLPEHPCLHPSPPGITTALQRSDDDDDSRDSFLRWEPSLDGGLPGCGDSDDEILPEVEIEQGDYKCQRLLSDPEEENEEEEEEEEKDGGSGSLQSGGDGDSACDSEDEFVDEDDEQAVLNLLDRRRNSGASKQESAEEIAAPTDPDDREDAPNFSKKKMKASELEEMHATSQRLLRETPNASFKPQMVSVKPVSSVLEKIRLRKLQLLQGKEASISRRREFTESVEVEAPDDDCNILKDMLPTGETSINLNNQTDAQEDELSRSTMLGIKNPLRAPVEDIQDLFSHSQSSQEDVDVNALCSVEDDDSNDVRNAPVNLHTDTETQTEYGNWQDADDNKENMAPAAVNPMRADRGPSIRALIDDEAEDEDEDELGLQDDEEEGDDDDGHGLGDMIVEETQEKKAEARKRAELHRKWLEQQDSVTTDDILLRLKSGWRATENRKRGLEFLDDVEEDADDDDNDNIVRHVPLKQPKRAIEEGILDDEHMNGLDSTGRNVENPMDEEPKRFNTFDDADDVHESSDDEEREHRIMRERFLQESEIQGEFTSPADDETSREVFVLINKVNIATKNRKLKAGSVDLRVLGGGSSNSSSNSGFKASFLKRKNITGLNSAQRQKGPSGGSGTRSFIFGRDDSNSSHSFADHQKHESMLNKENVEPPPAPSSSLSTVSTSSSSLIVKKKMGAPTAGKTMQSSTSKLASSPSLFDILRGQSTARNDVNSPAASMHHSQISPFFSAFSRPMKVSAAANRLVSK